MTEEQIIKWMRNRVKTNGFTDAATLAQEFLETHDINNTMDPTFSRTIDAGFKLANELAEV